MKTLYLECAMGAAGDMLTAALLELHPDPQGFVARMNALDLPGVEITAQKSAKCGITGTHVAVTVNGVAEESHDHHEHEHEHEHNHEPHEHHHGHEGEPPHGHHHSSLHDVAHILSHLAVPEAVRADVMAVYGLIAGAESAAHDCPVEQIHFHEVGAMDAIADVTAVCWLLAELAPEKIVASPVHLGSGHVHCAHGVLPVPAPATAYLLRGVPSYGGAVQGELCTPTGAALLKHFVGSYGPQPVMRVEKIGYGMGQKDFAQANCLRAMLGETQDSADTVTELRCNLDDMTPEAVAFAAEQLLAAGALDVYTLPAGMKKGRPGILLTCMCRADQREALLTLLFRHTTTLGVRESTSNRCTLTRSVATVQTKYGPVRVKTAKGWRVCRQKPEYEDMAAIARAQGVSLQQVQDEVQRLLNE